MLIQKFFPAVSLLQSDRNLQKQHTFNNSTAHLVMSCLFLQKLPWNRLRAKYEMLSSSGKAETSFHSDQLQADQTEEMAGQSSLFFSVILVHFPAQGWDSLWGRWYGIVCFVNFLSKTCLKEIIVTFWGLPSAEASLQSVVSHEQTGKKKKNNIPSSKWYKLLKIVLTVNVVLSHLFANTPIN